MSSLWTGLLRVVDKLPKRRPWKPDLKDMMDIGGEPGALFIMEDWISSSVNSTSGPPRRCWAFHMKAALYAVSLASEPAVAVKTWFMPLGATRRIPVSRMEAQSCCGKLPRAGLLIRADAMSGEVAARRRAGLLYPTGMEAICA